MGLFDKKYCDICGEKIGLLGNRKLEDGNLCKNCAAKLSPWFTERKQSTVEEIKEQLAYREANKEAVAAFHTTRTLGKDVKVLLDEDNGKFVVTSARNIAEANPDVLSFSDVTGCDLDIEEGRTEIEYEDREGNRHSFNPSRYAYNYDFYMVIHVNHPWFNQIRFRLNPDTVDGDVDTIIEYDQAGAMGGRSPMAGSGRPMAGSGAGRPQAGTAGARPQAGAGRPVTGAGRQQPGRPQAGAARPQAGGVRPMGQRPQQQVMPGQMMGQMPGQMAPGAAFGYDPTSNAEEIKNSVEYREYENMGWEIRDILMQVREGARAEAAEANAPKQAVKCPYCGATTIPTENGCCEYCGAAITG